MDETMIGRSCFGQDFKWGISTSAYQTEGAYNIDGKGESVWDRFTNTGKAYKRQTANIACDFYHRFEEDIALLATMHIRNFRFSISWSRILPFGTGKINYKGVDFYNKMIDTCLQYGIEPWITLYHWDLPMWLQQQGGWTNRLIIEWFSEYTKICITHFGDRVKYWMVLNEPLVFTGTGYFLGKHAPSKTGIKNFCAAYHHASLVQGIMPGYIRSLRKNLEIGTTFSCSYIEPFTHSAKNVFAARRADLMLNHLFLEPLLGNGYPLEAFKALERVHDYMQAGDDKLLAGEYDFIGIQNYTREIIKYSWYTPYLGARIVNASKRKVHHTQTNWEVYPESIYHMLKKFGSYPGVKKIFITENGAAFEDKITHQGIHDLSRIAYLKSYLSQVLRAKNEGVNICGYFVWSFTDNFEWAEGYRPKFGLVHIDFKTQQRTIKDSGYWYKDFLSGKNFILQDTKNMINTD